MIIKAIGISTTREIPAKIRTFRIIKVELLIVKIMADQISKFAGENFSLPCQIGLVTKKVNIRDKKIGAIFFIKLTFVHRHFLE